FHFRVVPLLATAVVANVEKDRHQQPGGGNSYAGHSRHFVCGQPEEHRASAAAVGGNLGDDRRDVAARFGGHLAQPHDVPPGWFGSPTTAHATRAYVCGGGRGSGLDCAHARQQLGHHGGGAVSCGGDGD